mmetsp:Transcript_77213/g.226455  ORF Transcript_77213/g.226455 Transcript_77213/m.226455 type:complete len:274 (+) Transcript_77213:351-1172(+)
MLYGRVEQICGRVFIRHHRVVGNLEAPLRQEEGERSLARSREPDQDQVGFAPQLRIVAVVELLGILDGFDHSQARVRQARPHQRHGHSCLAWDAEHRLHTGQHRLPQIHCSKLSLPHERFPPDLSAHRCSRLRPHQGVDHQRILLARSPRDLLYLARVADEGEAGHGDALAVVLVLVLELLEGQLDSPLPRVARAVRDHENRRRALLEEVLKVDGAPVLLIRLPRVGQGRDHPLEVRSAQAPQRGRPVALHADRLPTGPVVEERQLADVGAGA